MCKLSLPRSLILDLSTFLGLFEIGDDAPRKVQFTALYKDGDEWRGSASFTREDLPLLAKVADQVHSYLYEQNGSAGQ